MERAGLRQRHLRRRRNGRRRYAGGVPNLAAAKIAAPIEPRGPEYHAFAPKFDEVVAAEDLCESDELERLRSYLDKQLAPLAGHGGAACQLACNGS